MGKLGNLFFFNGQYTHDPLTQVTLRSSFRMRVQSPQELRCAIDTTRIKSRVHEQSESHESFHFDHHPVTLVRHVRALALLAMKRSNLACSCSSMSFHLSFLSFTHMKALSSFLHQQLDDLVVSLTESQIQSRLPHNGEFFSSSPSFSPFPIPKERNRHQKE